MFPNTKPYPQLLISPVQSEDQDDGFSYSAESFGMTDEDVPGDISNNNNSIEALTDDAVSESDKQWINSTSADSTRKSSLSSAGAAMSFNVNFPNVRLMKVPSFESKMSRLSPIPLALTPAQSVRLGGSSLSVRSSISSR